MSAIVDYQSDIGSMPLYWHGSQGLLSQHGFYLKSIMAAFFVMVYRCCCCIYSNYSGKVAMYCSMGSVTLEDCIAELGAENAAGVGARSATIARADRVADGA